VACAFVSLVLEFFYFCCDFVHFVDFVSFFGVGGGEFSWTA
jgi:hypothetical protein